jgi:hypothetical protein
MLQRETRQNWERYKDSRRKANKILQDKKKLYLKEQMKEIENLNTQHRTKKFYQAAKQITKGYQPRMGLCKSKYGNLIGTENYILERWAEYFEDMLNVKVDEEPESTEYTDELEITEPSLDEVRQAVESLRNSRAPGEDQLTAELLKNGGPELIRTLHKLICEIWVNETMPEDWGTSLICPIFKKGNKLNCSNYRGIMLLNVAYKVFSAILQKRLNSYAEEILGEYQCEFRPGRGTTD